MISEINITFNRFSKTMDVECKEGKKEIYIKDSSIKDFWHYSDTSLIKKIYEMLKIEEPKLNKKYNYTYLISRFLINGGDKTSLNITTNKNGTTVRYFNPEYWGKPVEGVISNLPATVEPLELLNDLPMSCALINKKYAQIFIDRIANEIKEFTARKTKEMKNLLKDVESLYGLKEDVYQFPVEEHVIAKAAKIQSKKTIKENHLDLV